MAASIGINPKLGINSLPELIAQAKKEPGSISYAVTGVGRLTHLTGPTLEVLMVMRFAPIDPANYAVLLSQAREADGGHIARPAQGTR